MVAVPPPPSAIQLSNRHVNRAVMQSMALLWGFGMLVLADCRVWRSYPSTILTQVWRRCSSITHRTLVYTSHSTSNMICALNVLHVTGSTTSTPSKYCSRSPFFISFYTTLLLRLRRYNS